MIINCIEKASLIKQCLTSSLILLVTGCSISVPQVESSYKFVKAVVLSEKVSSEEEQQAIWLASLGAHGAVLRPYLSSGLTVFANTDGDAIAFDGWTIRSVVGFGLQDPLSISGKKGVRTFTVDGQQTVTNCDQWILTGLSWRQTCSNGPGEILLNEEGSIQKITMAIGNGLGILTLRVAN